MPLVDLKLIEKKYRHEVSETEIVTNGFQQLRKQNRKGIRKVVLRSRYEDVHVITNMCCMEAGMEGCIRCPESSVNGSRNV